MIEKAILENDPFTHIGDLLDDIARVGLVSDC